MSIVGDEEWQASLAHTLEEGLVTTVDPNILAQLHQQASAGDEIRAALAEHLGSDPTADVRTLLAKLDETLTDLATAPGLAEAGTEIVNAEELAALRADAHMHRTAKERELVNAALRDGKIPFSDKSHWMNLLAVSPSAAETLASLPKGLIPVDGPQGYTGGMDAVAEGEPADDYERLYGEG